MSVGIEESFWCFIQPKTNCLKALISSSVILNYCRSSLKSSFDRAPWRMVLQLRNSRWRLLKVFISSSTITTSHNSIVELTVCIWFVSCPCAERRFCSRRSTFSTILLVFLCIKHTWTTCFYCGGSNQHLILLFEQIKLN